MQIYVCTFTTALTSSSRASDPINQLKQLQVVNTNDSTHICNCPSRHGLWPVTPCKFKCMPQQIPILSMIDTYATQQIGTVDFSREHKHSLSPYKVTARQLPQDAPHLDLELKESLASVA